MGARQQSRFALVEYRLLAALRGKMATLRNERKNQIVAAVCDEATGAVHPNSGIGGPLDA
jgi:hypothetical protein